MRRNHAGELLLAGTQRSICSRGRVEAESVRRNRYAELLSGGVAIMTTAQTRRAKRSFDDR